MVVHNNHTGESSFERVLNPKSNKKNYFRDGQIRIVSDLAKSHINFDWCLYKQ